MDTEQRDKREDALRATAELLHKIMLIPCRNAGDQEAKKDACEKTLSQDTRHGGRLSQSSPADTPKEVHGGRANNKTGHGGRADQHWEQLLREDQASWERLEQKARQVELSMAIVGPFLMLAWCLLEFLKG